MTKRRTTRCVAALLATIGGASVIGSARADDQKEICASSYEKAQKLQRDGKLRDARKELVVCGNEKCPSVLVPFCVQMLHDVDVAMPTMLIVAHDENGNATDDVRVLVDGEPLADKLDGRAMPIDPGTHVIRVERAGSAPWEDKILINEGEHGHRVEPSFAPKKTDGAAPVVTPKSGSAAAPSSGLSLWPAGVMFGVGGAGLIIGGALGGVALGAKSSLDKECATKATCPKSAQPDIDKLNAMGIGSTVGFAVGGAAVVTGIVLAVVASRSPSSTEKAATTKLQVVPWVSPFGAGLTGRF